MPAAAKGQLITDLISNRRPNSISSLDVTAPVRQVEHWSGWELEGSLFPSVKNFAGPALLRPVLRPCLCFVHAYASFVPCFARDYNYDR